MGLEVVGDGGWERGRKKKRKKFSVCVRERDSIGGGPLWG